MSKLSPSVRPHMAEYSLALTDRQARCSYDIGFLNLLAHAASKILNRQVAKNTAPKTDLVKLGALCALVVSI